MVIEMQVRCSFNIFSFKKIFIFNYQQQFGKQSVTAKSASEKCDQTSIPVPLSFRNKNTIVYKTSKGPGLYKIRSRRASMPLFTIADSEEDSNDGDDSDYVEKEEDLKIKICFDEV